MWGVSRIHAQRDNIGMWRLALSTVLRTMLYFTLPYLASYYFVIGLWRIIQLLASGRAD